MIKIQIYCPNLKQFKSFHALIFRFSDKAQQLSASENKH
jgi:hypothetical protein